MTRTDDPTLNEALGIEPAALTGLDQPLWLQNSTYPAALDRTLIEATIAAGVFSGADLAVTQRAAGANMSVDVAAGRAAVTLTDAPNQGRALCRATAVNNLVIGGAPAAGLTRIDRIVARVYDASLIGGSINGWQLEVVPGTPASSASPPSIPTSSLPLARVTVPAALASITNANITDDRAMTASGLPTTTERYWAGDPFIGPLTPGLTGSVLTHSFTSPPYATSMFVSGMGILNFSGGANAGGNVSVGGAGTNPAPTNAESGTATSAISNNYLTVPIVGYWANVPASTAVKIGITLTASAGYAGSVALRTTVVDVRNVPR